MGLEKIDKLSRFAQCNIRDWSLITGRGGYKMGGGAREVFPLRKGGGGAENVLAILKEGHKKFWGSFYVVA